MQQQSAQKKLMAGLRSNWKFACALVGAIVLLFFGLYSQTQVTLQWLSAYSFERAMWTFADLHNSYTLSVTYPRLLLLEHSEKVSAPVAIQLQTARTPTPIATPAVTPTLSSFVVVLHSASSAIEFTDKEGVPLLPQMDLTPTTIHSPAVMYLRQSQVVSGTRPRSVSIGIQIIDANGKEISLSTPLNINVDLESGEDLFYRRFWELAGTTSIFFSVVTALISIGLKWREKEREREDRERKEVESLQSLISDNLSEAARRYLEYVQKTEFPWQESEVKNRLQVIWDINAPKQLKHVVTLRRAFDENRWEEAVGQIDKEIDQSLVWAWRILDEDWQQNRIRPMLRGTVQESIKQELWQAIFKPWHHVCFWRDGCFAPPPDVAEGVRLLELQRNPFGSERAEFDELLFTCRVERAELGLLQTRQPHIVIGERGAGKTALAFFMVHDCVNSRTVFPVYVPTFPVDPSRHVQLDNLARAAARTLLHYLAFYPRSFLTQDIANRSALAHLLGLYIGIGSTLVLELQKAGLEPLGSGEQMLKELERLLPQVPLAAPPEDELIDLLGAARPREFERVSLLLDLHDILTTTETRASDLAHTLLDLMQPFQRAGVYLKIFLPAELGAVVQGNSALRLTWSDEELQSLLRKRLEFCGVDGQSLAILCDVSARTASPDARLVQAARGLPGRLIHLGNQLVARLASHSDHPRITAQDLDDVLSKLPN